MLIMYWVIVRPYASSRQSAVLCHIKPSNLNTLESSKFSLMLSVLNRLWGEDCQMTDTEYIVQTFCVPVGTEGRI